MTMLAEYLEEFAAVAKPTQPSKPGLTEMTIGPLQDVLTKLGERVGGDGKFGPITKAAWGRQAQKRGLEPAFDRASPTTAWVSVQTHIALSNAAYTPPPTPAPAPAPTAPKLPTSAITTAPRPGTVDKPVLHLQDLLFGVGWTLKKLARDGRYGPQTKGAWGVSARLRRLPELFERVDGATARVSQSTYDKILLDAGIVTPAPTPPTPTPTPTPPVTPVTPVGLVDKSVAELLGLLYGVGWTTKKLANDPRFGPQVKGAWQGSAKLRGLPGTFERVSGTVARVNETTYNAIKAKMPVKGAKPGPVTPTGKLAETAQGPLGTFKAGDQLQVVISENPTTGYHWDLVPTDVVAVVDTKYVSECPPPDPVRGPMVGCGGKEIFTLRALKSGSFQLGSIPPGRGTPTQFASYSVVVSASAQPKPGPTGTVDKSVAEILGILYGLGWTTKKLANDPRFGPQVRGAWQGSAGLRNLPKTFERVDGRTARVDATTYEALARKMPVPNGKKPEPKKPTEPTKPIKPSVEGTVPRPVIELQKLLQALKWRARTVPLNGKFGTGTANAWATSAKSRGLDQTFGKVDDKTARVNAKTYDTIKAEVDHITPEPPPKPPKDKLSADARYLIGAATASVSTETVQQAMAISAPLMTPPQTPGAVTGVWDAGTTELFIKLVSDRDPNKAKVESAWREALGHLVAKDGKSVKVTPGLASGLTKAAENWKKQQVEVKPDPVPPPPPDDQKPPPDDRKPPPDDYRPPPPDDRKPPPDDQPQPPPDDAKPPPAPSPEAENIWTAAVQALVQFTSSVPEVEHAKAAGKVLPETYAGWIKSVDGIKSQIAALIQASPPLKSAIDAAGGTVGFSGTSMRATVLEAYLGDLEAVSDTALELLRKSFSSAAGLSGLEQGPLKPLEVAVAEAGWVKLLQLFVNSPVVKAAAVTALAGTAAVGTVDVALNGETQAYLDFNKKICEETGKCAPLTPPGSGLGVVVLGLVALGGFALYMKNRAKSPGGS